MTGQIKTIWNKHIEVQEQLLRARAVPIPIDTTSIRIEGEKLLLTIDERNRTDKVLSKIAKTFGISIDEINISDGYFMVDAGKSKNVDAETKQELSETAEHDHIKFRPNPIVDGIIKQEKLSLKSILENKCDFSFDKKGRLQISVSDLRRLKSEVENHGVVFSNTASAILRFNPSPIFFLMLLIPNVDWQHKTTWQYEYEENSPTKKWLKPNIQLTNEYLSGDLLHTLYQQFGLYLHQYTFTFHVNKSELLKHQNLSFLPAAKEDGCTFKFSTILKKDISDLNGSIEEKYDFKFEFTRLKFLFDNTFGKENVSFDSQFEYHYEVKDFIDKFLPKLTNWEKPFWNELSQSLKLQGLSINSKFEIGIDFNWQKQSLEDILTKISSVCPYISLSFFDNHRCNVDYELKNEWLTEIENKIRESFPSIQFNRNEKKSTLYFFQEYFDRTKREQIVRSLNDELNLLNSSDYSYEIYSIPPDKDKYYLTIDTDSLQESLTDTVRDLRGYEFKVGNIPIGKLYKINYPQLTFDVSSSDKNLIVNNFGDYITPDLTGDLEKIARLRDSLRKISSGDSKDLLNPKLSAFIFNATKATVIKDIDCYIDSRSTFYNDINNNLLNKKINESQKQAIIKTLLAEDLALIQGPPGTGKSTAIAEIIWQHIRKNPEERILLTSETNLAVDNAIARVVNTTHNLVKPIRFGEDENLAMEGKQFNIDTLKAWVEQASITYSEEEEDIDEPNKESGIHQKIILENWLSNISRRIDTSRMDESICSLWKNMLQNPSKEIRQIAFDKYIHNCNVVGATCSSIGEKNTKGFFTRFFRSYRELFSEVDNNVSEEKKNNSTYRGKIKFDMVIQDESSKATPAELSLPLIYGKKNIIIGDHRQLPPLLDKEEFLSSLKFLLNKIDDKQQINEIKKLQKFVQVHFDEMEVSHFQRLFESIDDSLKGVFNQQYRMHPAINEVIKQFYVEDGGLFCGLDETQVEAPDVTNPQSRYHGLNIDGLIEPKDHVIWIDTKTPEMLVGTSRVNYGEVGAIRSVLSKMQNSESFKHYQSLWDNDEDKQIGLISFYGKQIKLLKSLRADFKDIPIKISTVDRFQGMERNIIIVSMVRSNCITADKNQNADYKLYPDLGFAPQNDLGFAQSPNRLNVALSRAKRLLIIVGNSDLFRRKQIYDNVYRCIQNSTNGKIINAEEL